MQQRHRIFQCFHCLTFVLSATASCIAGETFTDTFNGKALNQKVWEKSGTNKPLHTVRDDSLRLVSSGKGNYSQVMTKSGKFDFFTSPVKVIWDLIPERTLVGPHPNTKDSRDYAGLAIGGKDGTAAELGLIAWPEGYPSPKENAIWYYTLDLGVILAKQPKGDLRLSGVPRRIIWTLDKTNMTVEIKGAKFATGDTNKRSMPHGLAQDSFNSGFHLKIYTSSHETSIERNVDHLSGVVYTDGIAVNIVPPYTESKVEPIPTYKEMLEKLVGKNIPDSCSKQYFFGVNYAGGTFRADTFRVPEADSLDYFRKKGIGMMRLPINWPRIQPKLNGKLDTRYLNNVKKTVSMMGSCGMKVIIDLHDYGMHGEGNIIGTDKVPYEAYGDVWRRLASEFKDVRGLWGYGLMNEPYKLPDTWGKAAQYAIDGVRSADRKTTILVNGYFFGSARSWKKDSARLINEVRDPENNLWYEAHTYFDSHSAGKYNHSYEYEINQERVLVHPKMGEDRIRPFVEWLKENNVKGLLGETSVPANPDRDPRWLVIMDNAYRYLRKNKLPCTWWAAGTLWTPNRSYVVEPQKKWMMGLEDRPQLTIILHQANQAMKR